MILSSSSSRRDCFVLAWSASRTHARPGSGRNASLYTERAHTRGVVDEHVARGHYYYCTYNTSFDEQKPTATTCDGANSYTQKNPHISSGHRLISTSEYTITCIYTAAVNILSPLTCVHPGGRLKALVGGVLVAPSFPGRSGPRLLPEVREALQLLLLVGVHVHLVLGAWYLQTAACGVCSCCCATTLAPR